MSHDLLDDLLADVPRHVSAEPVAAWRAGTVRRRRRYAAEGLVVAVACVLVGLGLVRLHDRTPVQPVGPSKTVDGHPREVPRPFFEQEIPRAPGPAAGVVHTDGWHLIDAKGHSWRLSVADESYTPSLSDDGVRLAFMRSDGTGAGHVEVRNLVTGAVQSYDEVGEGSTEEGVPVTQQRFWTSVQAAGFWSPDGTRLLLIGGDVDRRRGHGGLLLEDGEVREVRAPGLPAGWTSPSTVAWYTAKNDSVAVIGLDGRVVREVRLHADPALTFVDQWGARVAPDGSRLAVLETEDGTALSVFSLDTGLETHIARDPKVEHPGPPVWKGSEVLWWDGLSLVDPTSGTTVLAFADRWFGIGAAEWSSQSLTGPAHDGPSPFGWRYWPVWWWWKQILIGLGIVLGGLALWWLDRWDTRRHLGAT
jgi:hypothetical protein